MVPMQKALFKNTSHDYAGFNMNIPYQYRMDQFEREFTRMWIKGKKKLPSLITMQVPNDHGAGVRPEDGYPYPHSFMADNDLAVGRILHFLSRTKYWKNMLVIITEDDPQGGVDHIDGHRSVGGSVMDKQGNLFMNIGEVEHGIVVLTKDSTWIQYDYMGVNASSGDYYGEMIIDDNSGFVWMNVQRSKRDNGIFVFDINESVDDLNDDRYRGPLSSSQDNDSRNVGEMNLIDQEGEVVTNIANCLVFDKDGFLWVGTDKGVLVNYRPRYVFEDETPRFNRIEIPRNDGTVNIDYLLENEVVTSIAVDGANRKWIGTQYSGIYLVSSDGTKTISHFTADNSALLSDYVYSIAINPKNGEVFIATSNGLVSYQGNAIEESNSMSSIYAYPNPVRPEYKGDITITGLLENSIIKITDVSGNIVYETKSLGGNAVWNGKNAWGENVQTGVYIVFVSNESGQNTKVTKVMIVR